MNLILPRVAMDARVLDAVQSTLTLPELGNSGLDESNLVAIEVPQSQGGGLEFRLCRQRITIARLLSSNTSSMPCRHPTRKQQT